MVMHVDAWAFLIKWSILQVWATFALCLTFSLAPRGKHMLTLISDSLVHCCAPWLFRLLSCLPGEGRMPPQNHSSQQPTRHDGEPWVTPTVQPHRPSDDPMHLPTVTPGLVLGPPPTPGVIAVDINSDSDIDVRSDRSNRVNLPALPIVHLLAVPAVQPAGRIR